MHRIATTFIALTCLAGDLSAQHAWTVTIERGFTKFSMAAHDTSTPQIRVVPWHPAAYSIRVSRDGERVGYSIALTAANGQLGATVGDAVILPGAGLLLLELAPEVRRSFATSSSGATLIGHVGPVFDIWAPEGDDVRSTFGGMAGTTLAVPLARRWEVEVRMDFAITGSEVTKAEESDQVIRARTMRRGRLALGITRTL